MPSEPNGVRSGVLDADHVASVQRRLLAWYAQHGRDLPWRRTRDAYRVLVAEVMLQQTQVDRVAPRWHAWLEQFPTLRHLGAASRADVIRAWHGLGYNLRAVRLHEMAGQVMAEYGGELPRSLDGLLKLRGVGRYTAGAVACFAYELPVSMVDTNVRRVLGRVFFSGSAPLRTEHVADAALPREAAYNWNQALMDLGATLCRVERPLCLVCPLLGVCRASASGTIAPTRVRRPSQPPFRGSTRHLRGRIVDRVRTLPSGVCLSPTRLAADLSDVDAQRLERVVHQLVSDGLIAIDSTCGGIRLP